MNNWQSKAHKDLQQIISKLSLDEYKKANRGKRRYNPYALTDEILEALRLSKICTQENTTREDEEQVKSFLLPFRTWRG
jgi:hypothetical protein